MIRFMLLLLFLGLNSAVRASDWPEFRGPGGQGLVAGRLPTEWGPGKQQVWKQKIPGQGWSSPVVVARRVYLTSAVEVAGSPGELSLRTYCLDASTGKIVWDVEAFRQGASAPAIHRKNSHASPTPLVHEQRLFVHFGHQGTACLDLQGKILWRHQQSYAPVHGNGGSPILVNDLLVFSCDGADSPFVLALDRATGKPRWKSERKGNAGRKFSFSTPLLITVGGRQQIISPGSDEVSALNPRDGSEIWRVRYDGYSVIPRPVFAKGLVFVCTGYNTPNLLAIRPDGQGDVTGTHVVWQTRRGVPHTPSLLAVGDELYMVSDRGIASCVDATTGKLHWSERLEGNFSASPLHAEGKIYFQSEEGKGFVVKASKTFELLATNDLEERSLASYAALDGEVLIRTEQHLYRFRGK